MSIKISRNEIVSKNGISKEEKIEVAEEVKQIIRSRSGVARQLEGVITTVGQDNLEISVTGGVLSNETIKQLINNGRSVKVDFDNGRKIRVGTNLRR